MLSAHKVNVANGFSINVSVLAEVANFGDGSQSATAELLVLPDLLDKLHRPIRHGVGPHVEGPRDLVEYELAALVRVLGRPFFTCLAVDEAGEAVQANVVKRSISDDASGALVVHEETVVAEVSPPGLLIEDDGLVVVAELGVVVYLLGALGQGRREVELLEHG